MARFGNENLVVSKPDSNQQVTLNYGTLKRAALTLRALNHPLRKEMVALIDQKKRITVTDLYVKMRLEQSVASQHLAILRRAEIVNTERDGKFIHYTVNANRIEEISKVLDGLAQKA